MGNGANPASPASTSVISGRHLGHGLDQFALARRIDRTTRPRRADGQAAQHDSWVVKALVEATPDLRARQGGEHAIGLPRHGAFGRVDHGQQLVALALGISAWQPKCRPVSPRWSGWYHRCGTAFLAAALAKYWFEQLARLAGGADIRSEFRYRASPSAEERAHARHIAIGRDGRHFGCHALCPRARATKLLAVVNSPESTNGAGGRLRAPHLAGPEIASPRPRPSPPSLSCWLPGHRRGAGRVVAIDAARGGAN